MKLSEIEATYDGRAQYTEKCTKCDRVQSVRTQEDNCPEYYTGVFVECPCGEWVKFSLPVN